MGRPSDYSDELVTTICGRLAEGQSLREICRDEELPAASTVFRWLAQNEGFQEQYARAKSAGIEALAEEILDIADNSQNDYMERKDEEGEGTGMADFQGEHVQRSRLRIDSRKWLLSKLAPKKYGDKLGIGGADDLPPVQSVHLDPEQYAKIRQKMIDKDEC